VQTVADARLSRRTGGVPRAARKTGSAWTEMWGRLWRIDTRFEAGQLSAIARELADLAVCVGRMQVPVAPR
jgi:hypothetical protein